jgi:hypothetical protein
MDSQEKLLTTAVEISKLVHYLYDSNENKGVWTNYRGYFIGGVNPFYYQTNNCLIIEGYYSMPVSEIHTPLGTWSVVGSGSGNHKIISEQLQDKVELKMICPGYQTNTGYYGPYWLVTSYNGVELDYPKIELLPPHVGLNLIRNPNDEKILDAYLKQKKLFYKNGKDYIEYNIANKIFDKYMYNWLKSGLIKDRLNLSLKLYNNEISYSDCLNEYLKLIDKESHDYVSYGTQNDVIFKAIYKSGLNI